MREYVKYSLYDRISTRPFLTSIEKKWITFQVLYALNQAHKVHATHLNITPCYSIIISESNSSIFFCFYTVWSLSWRHKVGEYHDN